MTDKNQYSQKTNEELVRIIENSGFEENARSQAKRELALRTVPEEELALYATQYFEEYFKKQVEGTILLEMNQPEFPKSEFLTEEDMKKVVDRVFKDVRFKRGGFYSQLNFYG